MAQHDYVIDNSTGANVRADINNALLAISSNNSGSSAPSTTYALQSFANTTDSMLQLRNAANSGFVDLRKFDGSCPLPDGTSSNLALFFTADTNTGLYRAGNDQINFVTAGSERLNLGAVTIFNDNGADVDFRIEGDTNVNLFFVDAGNNKIGINEDSPLGKLHVKSTDASVSSVNVGADELVLENNGSCGLSILSSTTNEGIIAFGDSGANSIGKISYNHSSNSLAFVTDSSEAFRIDSSSRLLVGTTSSRTVQGTSILQIEQDNTSLLSLVRTSNNNGAAFLTIGKTRNGAVVQDNDVIGVLNFHGDDGSDLATPAAQIRVAVDGTPGSNDMPGRIEFLTTLNGESASTERMRINNSGNVGIGVTDPDQLLEVAGVVAANDLKLGRLGDRFPVIQRHTASSGSQSLTICGGAGLSTFTGTEPAINDTTAGAGIRLSAGDPTSDPFGGGIQYIANGSTSPNNPGKGNQHVFLVRTAADTLTEKMRLNHNGALLINSTTQGSDELFKIFTDSTGPEMMQLRNNAASSTKDMITMMHVNNSGATMIRFKQTGGLSNVGSITTSSSATAYNTSSDYRLKENEVLISDGITRLKTLKPYRFNFKTEPDKTVDGFFAHEVTAVPEAVHGVKDAVETTYYAEGDTIPEGKAIGDIKEENVVLPQSLDYAKFTPLLTAALQEAISKIEVLETKVAALEAA